MPNLENFTRLSACDLPSITKDGLGVLVVYAAGVFCLPRPSLNMAPAPELLDIQPAMLREDLYYGRPECSSLIHEAPSAYTRVGTDIYLSGQAWAARGRKTAQVLVSCRVGPCQKSLLVFGDRWWKSGMLGLKMSGPVPFESLSLVYEHSFGGNSPISGDRFVSEPRNPVGRGLYTNSREARDGLLPNIEDPNNLIGAPDDRPAPVGLGPIARNWQPRLRYAGSYDDTWTRERAPLWPLDFDERFFSAASPGMVSTSPLHGGELVVLEGLSPDGDTRFPLPELRLSATAEFTDRVERALMTLDVVYLDSTHAALTMIWRATFPAHRSLSNHLNSTIRELSTWECPA